MSRVYVGNLDPQVSKRELEDNFLTFGVLRNVWVARRPRIYAFVEFDDHRDAMEAIRKLDGRNGWRVELSHNSKGGERGGGRGGGGGGHGRGQGKGRLRRRSPRRRKSPTYGHSISPMAIEFNLNSASGLQKLDKYLLTRYYITGDRASKDDITIHGALSKHPSPEYANASRWYYHIDALLQKFPGDFEEGNGVTLEGFAAILGEAVPTDTKVVRMDEDDEKHNEEDDELFRDLRLIREWRKNTYPWSPNDEGDEDGKSTKKISVLLDMMPQNNKTDMEKLEAAVRNIDLEWLTWGKSELLPIGQGMKKLQIRLTAVMDVDEDDLWPIDKLIMLHLLDGPVNEYVWNCEIVTFHQISRETS